MQLEQNFHCNLSPLYGVCEMCKNNIIKHQVALSNNKTKKIKIKK